MMRRFFALALPLAALSLLAACADPAEPGCPRIKTYTESEEQAITRAMQALPPGSPLLTAMQDYEDLRDQARACAHIPAR